MSIPLGILRLFPLIARSDCEVPLRLVLPIDDDEDEDEPAWSEDAPESSVSKSIMPDIVNATLAPSLQAMTT